MDSVSYDDCCMLPFDDKNPFVPVLGTDKIKILITPPDIKKCSSENLNFFLGWNDNVFKSQDI